MSSLSRIFSFKRNYREINGKAGVGGGGGVGTRVFKETYSHLWSCDFSGICPDPHLDPHMVFIEYGDRITNLDDKTIFWGKNWMFSYPFNLTFVLDAQKNHLIETVLLSTRNICSKEPSQNACLSW